MGQRLAGVPAGQRQQPELAERGDPEIRPASASAAPTWWLAEPMGPANKHPPPGCPVCARPATARYRPFCGRRCANVDLARWLRGAYVIATEESDEEVAGERGEETDEP